MRNLKVLGLSLLCTCVCVIASAQTKVPLNEPDLNKPKLFANLPDQIPVDVADLKKFFVNTIEAGKDAALPFADKKSGSFDGKVISAGSKYNNTIRSLIIRSTNFSGATLTLSSSIQPDGTVNYIGRIISFQHGDAFELEKKNDQYILVKKNFYDLVNE